MMVRGLFRRNATVDDLSKVVKRASVFMAVASTIMLIIWIVKRKHYSDQTKFLSLTIPILTLIMATFCNISARRKGFRFAIVAMCLSILLLGLHIANLALAIVTHSLGYVIALDFVVILFRLGFAVILYKFIMALYHDSAHFVRLSLSPDPSPSSDVPSFILTSSSSSLSPSSFTTYDQSNAPLVSS